MGINQKEAKMEKEKKAKALRALGKSAAEHSGGGNDPPTAKRSRGGKESSLGNDSDGEFSERGSSADTKAVENNTVMIHALLAKVASLEKEAKAAKESEAAEQGRC